jgi:PKD repeat protein
LENPVHAYLQGKYTITLIAKGCNGNDTLVYELNMPSETSLNSFSTSNIQVVPVPAQSELTITNISNISSCYAITAHGQQIELLLKVVDNTYVADIRNIHAGIYTLLIQKLDGKTMTVRFIKQ